MYSFTGMALRDRITGFILIFVVVESILTQCFIKHCQVSLYYLPLGTVFHIKYCIYCCYQHQTFYFRIYIYILYYIEIKLLQPAKKDLFTKAKNPCLKIKQFSFVRCVLNTKFHIIVAFL